MDYLARGETLAGDNPLKVTAAYVGRIAALESILDMSIVEEEGDEEA